MSLRLLDRIGTLLRADAHGVVDALEERSLRCFAVFARPPPDR